LASLFYFYASSPSLLHNPYLHLFCASQTKINISISLASLFISTQAVMKIWFVFLLNG
jgi:hypothetical protein